MGVEVVVGRADTAESTAVEHLLREWESTFSRFRPDSELSAVNASTGETLVVSPLFACVLRTALWAARVTDGLVDPTVGAAMVAAGYDRDLSLLGRDDRLPGDPTPGSWRSLRLAGRVLSRPRGVVLDLNGVVKGLAVDEAVARLRRGFVSAGGDLATKSELEAGLPDGGAVRVLGGGLATSGTTRRRWVRGGVEEHHLVDPRTGSPSTSRWEQVTVAAASCLAADVAAKAAFLRSEDGPSWLDERGLPGRFVAGGKIVLNDAWRRAVPGTPEPAAA